MAGCANCARGLDPAWKYCISCGARTSVPLSPDLTAAVRPDPIAEPERPRQVNTLAVLAIVLAALVSPLAALFGHLAVAQIGSTCERGLVPAWIAVVLGYVWLVALAVLVIGFIATDA